MARERHPGQKNNLDALCRRYGVDNARRTLHGALLDCELLAEVYLAMTRGQESLVMQQQDNLRTAGAVAQRARKPVVSQTASEAELAAHARYLDALRKDAGGQCVWTDGVGS
jgi:DNA polymerase-3 subunit epsilon